MRSLPPRLLSALWNALAGALPRIALLLAGLYVAHRFGPDEYARYSLAFATFALVGSLPGMTLTTVVSKFVPRFGDTPGGAAAAHVSARDVVTFTVSLAAAVGITALLLAPLVSQAFGVDPPVTGLIRAAAVAAVATILGGGAVGLLVGSARFGASAIAYGAGFAAFAATIVPLSGLFGAAGVLAAVAVLYLTAAGLAFFTSRVQLRESRGKPRGLAAIWRFFVPMIVAAGLVTPVLWLLNTLLSHGREPLEQLSRFNAAYSWFAVLSFVPAVLAQVEFVEIARARARGDVHGLTQKLRRFVAQNALVMLPLALAAVALAPWLVGVYGLQGPAAERTLLLMVAAAFVAGVANPAGLFLSATDRTWIASALNAAWGTLALVLGWLFRDAGAEGIALAFLVAYSLHFCVALVVAHRLLSAPSEGAD